MKESEQRRRQLEEMALVLEENKSLQASVKDLQACLLQERHHREYLEVQVLALEKERQQMEVEGQSMAKQLSRSTYRLKGRPWNFAFLVFSIVRCLTVIHSTGDGARPFPGDLRPALGGEGESRGEGQESQ